MSANTPCAATFSLTGFASRGGLTGEHVDGWGVAFYENPAWQIYTDSEACAKSPVAQWLTQNPIKSYQVIAHVRKATRGQVASENCHPFSHLHERRLWVFAHNGDLKNFTPHLHGAYEPQGNTDSEQAFGLLIQKIEQMDKNKLGDANEVFNSLLPVVRQIVAHGTFNFLLSNGDALFAHCSTNLHYVMRKHPFSKARLVDSNISLDLNEYNQPGDQMALIATQPLTSDETWVRVAPEQLLMFVDGVLVRTESVISGSSSSSSV